MVEPENGQHIEFLFRFRTGVRRFEGIYIANRGIWSRTHPGIKLAGWPNDRIVSWAPLQKETT